MVDKQDAVLLVQLAQWGTSLGLEEAMAAVFAEDFDATAASASDRPVGRLLIFGETMGTLTKHGLIDTALVLDWMWFAGAWARVEPAATKARNKHGMPALYENFEALAAQQGS